MSNWSKEFFVTTWNDRSIWKLAALRISFPTRHWNQRRWKKLDQKFKGWTTGWVRTFYVGGNWPIIASVSFEMLVKDSILKSTYINSFWKVCNTMSVTHSIRFASKWWCFDIGLFASEGWLPEQICVNISLWKLESIQRMFFLAGDFWDTAIWSNRFWNHIAMFWLRVATNPLAKGWLVTVDFSQTSSFS